MKCWQLLPLSLADLHKDLGSGARYFYCVCMNKNTIDIQSEHLSSLNEEILWIGL